MLWVHFLLESLNIQCVQETLNLKPNEQNAETVAAQLRKYKYVYK